MTERRDDRAAEAAATLSDAAVAQGLDMLGWTSVERYEQDFPDADLQSYLPGARAVVVLGLPMLHGAVDSLRLPPPKFIRDYWANVTARDLWRVARHPANLAKQLIKGALTDYNHRFHYAEHLEHINRRADQLTYVLGAALERQGHRVLPVDSCKRHYFPLSNFVSLKHAAAMAGLGRLGEHHQLMVPRHGPRVWLGGLLTTAALPPAREPPLQDPCPDCRRCVEACALARRAGGFTFPTHACTVCSACTAACPGLR